MNLQTETAETVTATKFLNWSATSAKPQRELWFDALLTVISRQQSSTAPCVIVIYILQIRGGP